MDPELTIRIDLKSTTPIYRQVADALIDQGAEQLVSESRESS